MCETACRVLGVSGVGITLTSSEQTGQMCASDEVAAAVEDLQFTLGEGPSVDAATTGRQAGDTNLAGASARWPAFAPAAVAAGIHAAFAFPLRLGAAALGVLTAFQAPAGPLGPSQHRDAIVVADVVTQSILLLQADAPAHELAAALLDAGAGRAQVHQAAGMVSVQLGIGVVDALVRLRSHAFATGMLIGEVATAVVSGNLRFEE